jgi:hypothetical protein
MTLAAGTSLGPYEIPSPQGAGSPVPVDVILNWQPPK